MCAMLSGVLLCHLAFVLLLVQRILKRGRRTSPGALRPAYFERRSDARCWRALQCVPASRHCVTFNSTTEFPNVWVALFIVFYVSSSGGNRRLAYASGAMLLYVLPRVTMTYGTLLSVHNGCYCRCYRCAPACCLELLRWSCCARADYWRRAMEQGVPLLEGHGSRARQPLVWKAHNRPQVQGGNAERAGSHGGSDSAFGRITSEPPLTQLDISCLQLSQFTQF